MHDSYALSRMRELPGPRGVPLLGTITPFIGKNLLRAFGGLVAEYGPLFGVRLPFGHRLIMVAHPDGVEQVLRSGRKNYVKGSVYDGARILLGQGLVTSEGELWRRQRELANAAFRPIKLAQYLTLMADSTAGLLADWHAANHVKSIDIQREMTRLTLSIVGRTLFGMDLGLEHERAAKAFGAALQAIGRRGPGLLQVPLWLPTPANVGFRSTLNELDQMTYRAIREFRAGRAENADQTLLGAYIESRDPDTGAGMDDRQLRDEIITLYLAGHETTASLLAWALYQLSRHPEIQARVRDEIDAELTDQQPTFEQLKALQYTSQVINEVLRLYPQAWTVARNAIQEDAIMGRQVTAGAIVMVSPYFAHRLAEFWPEPSRFDPERFAPAAIAGSHPFAYFPFSLGPRICIGMQFALYEARLVLGMLLRQFDVHTVSGPEVGTCALGTLRPDGELRVLLRPR
jgi:cytochrome P450